MILFSQIYSSQICSRQYWTEALKITLVLNFKARITDTLPLEKISLLFFYALSVLLISRRPRSLALGESSSICRNFLSFYLLPL